MPNFTQDSLPIINVGERNVLRASAQNSENAYVHFRDGVPFSDPDTQALLSITNPGKRHLAIALLVDTSSGMPIDELNQPLADFGDVLQDYPIVRAHTEICIIAFNSAVWTGKTFTRLLNMRLPRCLALVRPLGTKRSNLVWMRWKPVRKNTAKTV